MRIMLFSVVLYLCVLFVCCDAAFMNNVMSVTVTGDDSLPTPEMIKRAGYPSETHSIETEDGFILGIHRIPGRNSSNGINADRPPIILQHGMMDSSADWVISGIGKGLAYLLADRGYDVWLGNSRGNVYSRAHKTLSPQDDKFWNWTWHEMGYYDLPAVIDYILNATGHKKLQYVGHSMGTTMFFVMCSTKPEYNEKVSYMAALAPVAFMGNTKSPVRYLARYADNFEKIFEILGHGELALNSVWKVLLKFICEATTWQKEVCENLMFLVVGFDSKELDLNLLPLILGHNPAGTSSKTLVHYAQEINSKKFCQFDHGEEMNIILYNSTTPPEYNLSLVTAPMSLHYAFNDLLATPTDVKHLFQNLHDKVKMYKVNFEKFNHLDFLWGHDATKLVYNKLFKLLHKSTLNLSRHSEVVPQREVFGNNILLAKKFEVEEKAETKPKSPPKKEEAKSVKKEEKVDAKAESKSMFDGILEKLPGYQNAIVDKLVSLQQFIAKRIGYKRK